MYGCHMIISEEPFFQLNVYQRIPLLPSPRERDSDKDGKISFEEFFHGLFDTVRNYEEDNHNSTHPYHDLPEGPAKQLFSQLDKNDDGFVIYEYTP